MFLQKVLNPIDSLLIRHKYNGRINPFIEFAKIKKNTPLPPANKGNILIGSIRMFGVAHLFEGLLAYKYRLKGYKVYALMCGQELESCESKDLKLLSNLGCTVCYSEQKLFCETFEIEPLYIRDYIDKKESSSIKNSANQLTINKMEYKSIDFSPEITSGLMRVLKTSNVKEEKHLDLLRKYAITCFKTYQATINILDKIKPIHTIMSHGVYSTWGSMIKACNVLNYHSVVWGRGYVGTGNIMATHNNSYLFENTIDPISNYINRELSAEQEINVLEYFRDKRTPTSKVDYVSYYKDQSINQIIDIKEKLNIPKEKIVFGMFPNIPWDGQLFSASDFFKGISVFVKSTITWVIENPEVHLIIRAHPAEKHIRSLNQAETFKDILFGLFPSLPENVTFLDSNSNISSYQIEEHIQVALLYAGTIGLEFVVNKTPVIQTGMNFSSNKGFLFEPNSEEEYYIMLDKFKKNELSVTKKMYDHVLKYAYYWVFEKHIPETLVKLENELEFNGFQFKSIDELNNNNVLNWFVTRIEKKQPFIYC